MCAASNAYIDTQHEQAQKDDMTSSGAAAHWRAASNGANVGAVMALYYPATENTVAETVRTSIKLTREQHADIGLICDLWNEFDAALGKKRRRKWSDAAVIERMLTVSIDKFWTEIGGRPPRDEDRKMFVRRVVEGMRKNSAPKK